MRYLDADKKWHTEFTTSCDQIRWSIKDDYILKKFSREDFAETIDSLNEFIDGNPVHDNMVDAVKQDLFNRLNFRLANIAILEQRESLLKKTRFGAGLFLGTLAADSEVSR